MSQECPNAEYGSQCVLSAEVERLRAERRWLLENSEHAKEMQRLLTEFGFTKNHIGDATEKEDK